MTKRASPPSPKLMNLLKAFLIGGLICAIGEGFSMLYESLVADEKTENIEQALRGNRKLSVCISGPASSVLSSIKKINGVTYAACSVSYGDGSSLFVIESQNNVDIRKPLFYMLAQNGWPILSMQYLGANIEDIFISVVDESEKEEGGKRK